VKQADESWLLKLYVVQNFLTEVFTKWQEGSWAYPTISLKRVRGSSEILLLHVDETAQAETSFWQCSCQSQNETPKECLNLARHYLEDQLGFRFSEEPLVVKTFALYGKQIGKLCGQGGHTIKSITRELGVDVRFPNKGESGLTSVEGAELAINKFEKKVEGILQVEIKELKQTTWANHVAGGPVKGPPKTVKALKPIIKPSRSEVTECLFFETNDPQDEDDFKVFLEYLLSGDRTLDICVYTITDNKIANAILSESRRGVKVRIITDNDKANDLGSDIYRLARAGIPVKFDKTDAHMHHKFALIDSKLLMNGSYNWTVAAKSRNLENVVISNNPKMVRSFQMHFNHLWNSEHMVKVEC